ncbi:hypothetical protein DR62_4909 [Burkholderia thailandensis]|nr:hypothetical protein DR62_4909 [Burkholderia thailandensis]AOI53700.1 hypothetical protein WI24_17330 [Burkholderia thailandensis]PJO72795.1 hypothetical protein CWD92_08885 [Burkholderia thailandensis]TBW61531.1 hypothetical protein EZV77_16450 [Burkholderia thailandensis]
MRMQLRSHGDAREAARAMQADRRNVNACVPTDADAALICGKAAEKRRKGFGGAVRGIEGAQRDAPVMRRREAIARALRGWAIRCEPESLIVIDASRMRPSQAISR